MKNALFILALLALALSFTACQKAPKVYAGPPPPQPGASSSPADATPPTKPATPPAESKDVPPKKVEPTPEVAPPTVPPATPPPETKDVPPVMPDKPPPTRNPLRPPKAPPLAPPLPKADTAPPKQDPVPAPAPTVPAPTTTIVASLPPAEQYAYRRRAERAILDAQRNIDVLKEARISRDDQSTLRQAATFLRDAQRLLKAGDVVGATTLGEKARLLSQDLRRRYS